MRPLIRLRKKPSSKNFGFTKGEVKYQDIKLIAKGTAGHCRTPYSRVCVSYHAKNSRNARNAKYNGKRQIPNFVGFCGLATIFSEEAGIPRN